MNSNLPKFAMVMTSEDADVKRANRELRQDLSETKQAAAATAPAFEQQAEATNKAAAAQQRLSQATETAAAATKRSIASIGVAADQIKPSMDRLINSFAGITAPAANRNGRAADIIAYGQELDRLQAKFDPLFAAQSRYQAKLEEIGQAERVGALSASAAIDARIRETNAINALVNNLDRLAMARKRAAEGAVGALTITPDRGADIEAYGQQLDAMRAKYNPVFATLTQYKAQLAEIREAHRVGAISADEMAEAISRQRQSALATVAALKGREASGAGGTMDRFRLQNLGYQGFDVGQSLLGGMPLPLIAAQQGPQIAQMYAGQGGTSAFLKDIGTLATGASKAITPLTVGIAGLTTVVLAGAVAYNGYLKSTKEVETAAAGLGRATAGAAASMEAAAQAGAAAAGISVSSARSMEAQFLRTGRIGSENFEQLIAISKDFGATVGLDAEAAGAALAEMFSDPAKAAQVLYQQYGLIDAATARQATNLAKQNRESEAQALLLKALPDQLADASEATTKLGRAWQSVSNFASNAFDAMGSAINRAVEGPSLEDRIALARARHEGLSQSWGPDRLLAGSAQRDLEELENEKEMRDYNDAVAKREAERIKRSRAAMDAASGSGANSSAIRQQTLRNEIAAIQNGRDGLTGEDARQADAALEAKQRVLDALINRQSRLAEIDRLDVQIQTERNPLLRAELEARRVRLELADQEISSEQLAADATRARNRVIEETIGAAQNQVQDMQAELEARIRLNSMVASGAVTTEDANRMLQEELALRPLIAAAAVAEGEAKERLNRTIEDMRSAYAGLAEQQKLASAQEYLRSGNERIEQLRVEQALIGANEGVRAQAMARLQAEQEIRRRGLDSNSDLAKQIRDQADATAQLNRQIEKQAEAWDKVQSAAEGAIDGVVDKLSEGDFSGILDELKDTVTGFVKDDIKAGLKNALLGTDYGTSADIGGIGGIFSRLFGGGKKDVGSIVSGAMGQSVGAMSVNAGVVNINGGAGVNDLLSSLTGAANDNAAGGYSGLAKVMPVTRSMLPDVSASAAGSDVASYIAKAAAQRGIDPAIALAVAKSEGGLSSWNLQSSVMKNGIREQSYGPFQLYMNGGLGNKFMSQTGLDPRLAANGPAGIDFALDYASKNGWGSWYGAAKAGISKWQGIGEGGNASDAVNKLAAASGKATASLGTLGQGVSTAAQGLGNLGTGFDKFGQNLTSFYPAAPSGGGGGGLFGSLFGGLFGGGLSSYGQAAYSASPQFANAWNLGGIGLYSGGGYTGPGGVNEPRGVVHAGEVVWSQADVARAGGPATVEAMRLGRRGYASGGYVSSLGPVYAGAANSNRMSADNRPVLQILNQTSTPINGQVEETEDESGRRQYRLTLSDEVGQAVEQKGGGFRRAMNRQYGLRPRGIGR